MPAPGDTLNGRYRLDDLIAAGGMGQVWRATDIVLGRPVAVKMLLVERSGDPSFRQRFEHEARAMAALRHPGIAAVYDFGTSDDAGNDGSNGRDGDGDNPGGGDHDGVSSSDDGSGGSSSGGSSSGSSDDETGRGGDSSGGSGGRGGRGGGGGAYLVMARIDGQPLDQRIEERGRLSPDETAALIAQVASALQAVHRAGIVHRDVTPGNLIIEPDGNVVLVDFGVARSALSVTLTGARNVIGTASYMAPEQVAKQTVGPAADLYALGAVAYHCLAGHPPFEGGDAVSIALRHVTDEPSPLPADVPSALRTLVTRAMAKDPADRHPSAAAMATAAGDVSPQALATEQDTVSLHREKRRILVPTLVTLAAVFATADAVVLVTDPFGWFDTIPATTIPTPSAPAGASPFPSRIPTPKNTISSTAVKKSPPPENPRPSRSRTRSPSPASPSASPSVTPDESTPHSPPPDDDDNSSPDAEVP